MRAYDLVASSMAVASAGLAQLSTAPSTVPSSSISQSRSSTLMSTTSSTVLSSSTLLSSDWPSSTEASSSTSSQATTLMTSISNNATDTVMSIVTKPVTTKIVDVWVTEKSPPSVAPTTVTVISTVTANTTTSEPTQSPTGMCKLKYIDRGYSVQPHWNFEISGSDWSPGKLQHAAEKCGVISNFDIDPYNPAGPFNWTATGIHHKKWGTGGYDGGLACLQTEFEQAGAPANLHCDVEREVPEMAATCFTHYWTFWDKFNIQGTRDWSYKDVEKAASKCGVVSEFDIVDFCDVGSTYADSDRCNYGWSWRATGHLGIAWDLQASCLEKHLKKYTDMPAEANCGRWYEPQGVDGWTDTEYEYWRFGGG